PWSEERARIQAARHEIFRSAGGQRRRWRDARELRRRGPNLLVAGLIARRRVVRHSACAAVVLVVVRRFVDVVRLRPVRRVVIGSWYISLFTWRIDQRLQALLTVLQLLK